MLLAGVVLYARWQRPPQIRVVPLAQASCVHQYARESEACQRACSRTSYECAKACVEQFNPVLHRCVVRADFASTLREVYSVGSALQPGELNNELLPLLPFPNPCPGARDDRPLVVRVMVSDGKIASLVISGESDPAAQACVRERLVRHKFKQAEGKFVAMLARLDDPRPLLKPPPKKSEPPARAAFDDPALLLQKDAGVQNPVGGRVARVAAPPRVLDVFDLPDELRGKRGKPLVVLFYSHEGFAHEPLRELRKIALEYGDKVQLAAYGAVPAEDHANLMRFAAQYAEIIDPVRINTPDPKKPYLREALQKIALAPPEGEPIMLPLYGVYDASGTLVSRGQSIFDLYMVREGLRTIRLAARR